MFIRSFVFLIFVLCAALPAAAQDWSDVEALRTDTRVVVALKRGDEIKGKISAVSPSALQLRRDGQTVSLNRDEIQTIHLTRKGGMLKRALIGAAAGAGIGVALGVVVTVATKGDGLAAAGGFLYGIPAGAAIGAATTGRKRGSLVYSSR